MLTPALITSFNPSVSLASPDLDQMPDEEFYLNVWPKTAEVDVDLYLMMESDVAKWTNVLQLQGLKKGSALEFLGKIAGMDRRQEYWHRIAATAVANTERCGKRIKGITTFLPEINSEPNAVRGGIASRAFASLFGIALEIAEIASDDSQRYAPMVQSVAGSVIYDFKKHPTVYRGGENREVVHAVRRSEKAIIETLLSNLEKALVDVGRTYPGAESSIRIPLELEPGHLYSFGSIETLCEIDSMLEKHSELIRSTVGYNLDIPHWMLCGDATSEWIGGRKASTTGWLATRQIRERIFHSHISGHSRKGHFGDFPLSLLSVAERKKEREELLGWLYQISDLPNCKTVSLEHEAASCMKDVESSATTLCDWLKMVETRRRARA